MNPNTCTKPAKLEGREVWVSVVRVVGGTGVADKELGWSVLATRVEPYAVTQYACLWAERWYEDTDQCGECIVTLRFEDARGKVVEVPVQCEIVIRCTEYRGKDGEAKS